MEWFVCKDFGLLCLVVFVLGSALFIENRFSEDRVNYFLKMGKR